MVIKKFFRTATPTAVIYNREREDKMYRLNGVTSKELSVLFNISQKQAIEKIKGIAKMNNVKLTYEEMVKLKRHLKYNTLEELEKDLEVLND